ncbi:hypothetical protein FB446DRAFT_633629 [Lentinula raphanica]|nr:hypothetical protein FB446DRAFT_633629 [Lentinula raphanica]
MLRTLSRTSSKPKRFSTRVPTLYIVASDGNIDHKRPSPRIPLELIEHVLSFLPWGICTRSTLSFAFTSGFALASRTFREMVFKAFFRSISLQDACWKRTLKIVSIARDRTHDTIGFTLIRSIYAPLSSMKINFHGLRHLRLNFEQEGLQTQHPICQRLFPNLASSKLSCLVIDMLPRIDRTLLSSISKSFPCLESLKLSVTGRLTIERACFCWCCFEDVLECCCHSPIPDSHGDVELLAKTYATALQPLCDLIELQLGVLLSEERMIYQHMVHSNEQDNDSIVTSPYDCTVCGNYKHEVRSREGVASKIIFQSLPNLRQMKWSTFFFDHPSQVTSASEMERPPFWLGWAKFERRNESFVRL